MQGQSEVPRPACWHGHSEREYAAPLLAATHPHPLAHPAREQHQADAVVSHGVGAAAVGLRQQRLVPLLFYVLVPTGALVSCA